MNTNDEMKMRVPLYVLNPRAPFTKDDYDAGKESYVEITEMNWLELSSVSNGNMGLHMTAFVKLRLT